MKVILTYVYNDSFYIAKSINTYSNTGKYYMKDDNKSYIILKTADDFITHNIILITSSEYTNEDFYDDEIIIGEFTLEEFKELPKTHTEYFI